MGKLAIRQLRAHPVLNFASEELQAISEVYAGATAVCAKQWIIGTWSDCERHLLAAPLDPVAAKPAWPWQKESEGGQERAGDEYPEDAYVILCREDVVILAGRCERAALYAVYAYCKEEFRIEWVYPGEAAVRVSRQADGPEREQTRAHDADRPAVQVPSMRRRGFVYENLRDEPYLLAVIDWLAKNRINELFMTFMLWDELGSALAPELAKRGIALTLGGHSMKFFMPELMEKNQLDYSDLSWQDGVIAGIVQYCGKVPSSLTRISLWPEDAAIADNEAEKKRFLSGYIRFTERIKEAMSAAGIEIAVEHIAYNAGLSWDMLELLDGVEASERNDVLFAYWGRDYSRPWSFSDSRAEDARAARALERWAAKAADKNRNICVFEYYSDHFMLSSLFPALPERIYDDLELFKQLGIDSVTNLVVPCSHAGTEYSWKWAQGYNSYLFARCAWGDSAKAALADYWQYAPASERAFLRAAVDRVGSKLARLTRYNFPLFPARVVDGKKLTAPVAEAGDIRAELKQLEADVQTTLAHLLRGEGAGLEPFRTYFNHLGETIGELSRDWAENEVLG
ncbi:hypothetical protein PAT3040_06615 [Paenibacillus agaridevorans]|uniref:Uncharacterized protein n=1 Tax=Paenibacillus agaridevorans TaxID=171404 RepID=A0A2R5F2G1_9BACL|nr:hypothetical protein [Paenibacillus agaridevorans]GBG11768.1 hypothetical protein PAT3040_06615 [Paenibacillus agaridevorans]